MKIIKNPYLLFSPFLIFYIIYILVVGSNFDGDEVSYLGYADHITHGYYSPPAPDIILTNGPGYPLILAPFVALGIPPVYMALMNAFFYYFSIILLYKALMLTVSARLALIASLFWACYYIAYQNLNSTMTEPFTFLLVAVLIFSLVKVFKPDPGKSKRYIWIAGFTFGYIALTKMIFGYVLYLMLAGYIVFWLINFRNTTYKKMVYVLLIALLTVAPYLLYTYSITGRMLYWGFGKDSFYWMTTPYDDEYGDWKGALVMGTVEMGNFNIPGSVDTLKARHGKDFEEVYKSIGVERDDVWKELAMRNLKAHPLKFAENVMYNIGRMVFHYPFTYAVQRPKVLYVLPINAVVFTFILLCLIPTLINWRRLDHVVRFLLFFCFLYLGLSSMVSAQVRMLTIAVPVLLFWFAYIIEKTTIIKLKLDDNSPSE
jgi:4-amino-4-deoxy-L-arabinose transferase-like glycosyltransferase